MNVRARISILLFMILVIFNVGCDQISKNRVRSSVQPGEIIEVINDYLILTNTENTGAFFGLGENMKPVMKIIFLQMIPLLSLLLLLGFVFYNLQSANRYFILGMSFVIGGGIGNIFDRVRLGSVTDFLYIDMGWVRTGIFNMADVSVLIGAFFLIIYFYRVQVAKARQASVIEHIEDSVT